MIYLKKLSKEKLLARLDRATRTVWTSTQGCLFWLQKRSVQLGVKQKLGFGLGFISLLLQALSYLQVRLAGLLADWLSPLPGAQTLCVWCVG